MDSAMRSNLRTMRQRIGIKQHELADRVGVSRQTLSAIEAGATVPSTLIALGLARVLRCKVEDLFTVEDDSSQIRAWLAEDPAAPERASSAGPMRVALAQVGVDWIARPLDGDAALALGTPADGIASKARKQKEAADVTVRPLRDLDALRRNLFVAGCDPALGLLGRHLEEQLGGPRLHWVDRASRAALDELAAGHVHVAGLHLDDMSQGNLNAATVRARFGDRAMMLVTLAAWELGLVSRHQDKGGYKTAADLVRKKARVIGRELGSGARQLLDSALKVARLSWDNLDVAAIARGHRSVAQMVAAGVGDVGISTQAAAAPFGLDFVPLAETRFDLALEAESASDARVQRLLECMASARFRKDLGAMTGYHSKKTGSIVQAA
jgi:molybdate-binding protein/DNA-binding XRE family transcriptional regulator